MWQRSCHGCRLDGAPTPPSLPPSPPAFLEYSVWPYVEELVQAVASWAALPLSDMPNWPGKNEGCLFARVLVATHSFYDSTLKSKPKRFETQVEQKSILASGGCVKGCH